MSATWLLLHYKSHDFDVRVLDTDKCQLIDIFLDIFEESRKQNVFLPEKFRLYTNSPTGRVELVDDSVMIRMWGWNMGKDTVELWIEDSDSPGLAFRSAVALLDMQRKELEKKLRERQEELLRMQREAEEQRRKEEEKERVRLELEEQKKYTVAMEVPVVDVENDGVEYVRVITTEDADEVFPGQSQPQPQTQDSPPPKKPTKSKPRKKLTPKKKKTPKNAPPKPTKTTTTPESTTQTPPPPPESRQQTPPPPPQSRQHTPSPPPQSTQQTPSPPPQSTQHTPSPPPQQTQTENAAPTEPQANIPEPSVPSKPKKTGRARPKGFRVGKPTLVKLGTYVAKTNASKVKRGAGRACKGKGVAVLSDNEDDEDSEDDDYEGEVSDDDSEDEEDIGDFIIAEEGLEDLQDDIPEKTFEDCLDGSARMDRNYKNGKVYVEQPYGSIRLEPWLIFKDRESFMNVLMDYCIQEGFGLSVEKSDNLRYTAVCAIEGCDWRIHASKMVDKFSWAIKCMSGEHKLCGRLEVNPIVTTNWLVRKLLPDIEANLEIPVVTLQRYAQERFQIEVKPRLFYKVKAVAKEIIHGSFSESYALLPRYAEMIKETNPGSYALVTWHSVSGDVQPKFKACFFSFAAQFRGFLTGCRPIIGIDGSHLSGYFKGILLAALGIDGNNEIFLLAYGVVDTESQESWNYFMRNLRAVFQQEGCNRDDWTFISDRMRGVDLAVHENFPRATRRCCSQHLYMNYKNGGWSGELFHKLFWIAANAFNPYVFNKAIEKITDFDPNATKYLDTCTEQWSRHQFDPEVCCDHNTTNFVESFNALTKPYRDLPVLTLFEAIRQWAMQRIGVRFDKAVNMEPHQLTEYARQELELRGAESRFCYSTPCGGGEYEVRDGNVHFPVRIDTRRCGCGVWQVSGIPCKHGLRVIYNQRLSPEDFVSGYFKGAAYKQTYAEHMHPMPDPSQWPEYSLPTINPPGIKRSAGRPPKQRKRNAMEAKKRKRHSSVKCGKCKEMGHNARTCKNGAGSSKAPPKQRAPTKKRKASSDGASTSKAPPKGKRSKQA
ncbi:uncharacterized protein [Spinacia oleracea]|uniref:SWIM-type domain-containing protein n=1 Tax=Spinacia oleracea TaxID=3562 RepID=A0ABM3RMJ0_SPIOL|nr:uncharacterized protein LOC110782216 [Spinacia oleracea]